MGQTYYSRVGIPSILSTHYFTGNYRHKYHPVEVDANRLAFNYFSQTVDGFDSSAWNSIKNPLSNNVDKIFLSDDRYAYACSLFPSGLIPMTIDYLDYVSPFFSVIIGCLNSLIYKSMPY